MLFSTSWYKSIFVFNIIIEDIDNSYMIMDHSIGDSEMPCVRVVIPTYNRAILISDALNSIISQTFSDIEVVICDDGSTDDTEQIVRGFCDSDQRIRYFRQVNAGVAAARNAAIRFPGTFSYVAFLDSDDLWIDRNHLERSVRTLERNPEIGLLYAKIETVDSTGHWTAERIKEREQRFSYPKRHCLRETQEGALVIDPESCFLGLLKGDLAPPTPTVVLRRSAVEIDPWFDTKLNVFEDISFFTRIARKRLFGFFDFVVCRVRYQGDNLTRTAADLRSPQTLIRFQSLLRHSQAMSALCKTRAERTIVATAIAYHAYLVGQCFGEQERYREARSAYIDAITNRFSFVTLKSLAGTIVRQVVNSRG